MVCTGVSPKSSNLKSLHVIVTLLLDFVNPTPGVVEPCAVDTLNPSNNCACVLMVDVSEAPKDSVVFTHTPPRSLSNALFPSISTDLFPKKTILPDKLLAVMLLLKSA